MLSRIYVDNYGPLVNFELKLSHEQLLIGRNGTGKSTLFEAVDAVTRFARGEGSVDGLFPASRKTKWDTRSDQTFELEFASDTAESFTYRLVIQHDAKKAMRRVHEEKLSVGSTALFSAELGKAQLYRDNGSKGPEVLVDWSRSSLPAIDGRTDNTKLTSAKVRLARVRVFSPDPRQISSVSEREEPSPARNLSNVASWYRYLVQERPDHAESMRDALRGVLEGFHGISLATEGSGKRMITNWRTADGVQSKSKSMEFTLDQLSDGQRVLICLAALAAESEELDTTLFLDEPDNFVALAEVQPLLMSLRGRAKLQVIVISHHPEVINLQAADHGLVFEREGVGPTRVRRFKAPSETTLTPAELVARGEE